MSVALDRSKGSGNASAPRVSLGSLDTLWFQVGGTVCNLACTTVSSPARQPTILTR